MLSKHHHWKKNDNMKANKQKRTIHQMKKKIHHCAKENLNENNLADLSAHQCHESVSIWERIGQILYDLKSFDIFTVMSRSLYLLLLFSLLLLKRLLTTSLLSLVSLLFQHRVIWINSNFETGTRISFRSVSYLKKMIR